MVGEGKHKVWPVELVKELVVEPGGLPPVRSSYDDFVEGVATRDIAKREGIDSGKSARVFKTEDSNGDSTVHLVGRKDIVDELGDVMERGGYRVREWHVRRPNDPVVEGERIRPALEELVRSIPVPILNNPIEFINKALGLPLKMDEVVNALSEFKGGGVKDEK
ncbi:MAG: hypothetical protein DDT25_01004 [Chloroflexi bacterium]|nr:hypothetical protein [Chloroflexota bacterium]